MTAVGRRRLELALAMLLGLGLCLGFGAGSRAGTFEAGGLTFSDELGGFRLLSASGLGTASDPIVLVEEIFDLNPAVLTIRQAGVEQSRTPSERILLRSLIKVVINRSAWRWSGFDLELRNDLGLASVYSDGLSFDQLQAIPTPLASDLFAAIRAEDEPHDRLRFDQGRVDPDQAVQLAFNLIDLNPRSLFHLAQAPIILLTYLPGPSGRAEGPYAGFVAAPASARHRLAILPMSP
jgi:hypothetical protein